MGTPVEEKKREGKIGAEGGRGLYVGKVGGPGSPSSDTRQMRTEGVALGSQLPAVVARQRTWPEEAMVAAEMKGEAARRRRMQTRWPPRSSRGPAEDERERSGGGGWCRPGADLQGMPVVARHTLGSSRHLYIIEFFYIKKGSNLRLVCLPHADADSQNNSGGLNLESRRE
jgi:hypothetical protein